MDIHELRYPEKEITPGRFDPHVRPNGGSLQGSETIRDILLKNSDPHFAKYRTIGFEKLKQGEELTLAEAIEVAGNYISACSDLRAQKLDRDCEMIGGDIRVATITPEKGFEWVPWPPMSRGTTL